MGRREEGIDGGIDGKEVTYSSGSCGMTQMDLRRSLRGTVHVGTPSIVTVPSVSDVRSNAPTSDDLPEPDLPTTPEASAVRTRASER